MSLVYLQDTTSSTKYFFDAVFKETHTLENTITSNPVQTGANVNDHVYQQPITVALEIGVSDCMASVVTGQYSTGSSRSVAAYSVLLSLWQTAHLLNVSTSFVTYKNMLIKTVSSYRDPKIMTAMKATITLQQLILVNAVSVSISSDKQTTDSTSKGTVNSSTTTYDALGIGGKYLK